MEHQDTPLSSLCFYHSDRKIRVRLTSSEEKTLEEAEAELMPILQSYWINHLLELAVDKGAEEDPGHERGEGDQYRGSSEDND